MNFTIYSCTDAGKQKINEDCFDYFFDEKQGFFVVADGLGGHQKGDFASKEVCRMLLSAWKDRESEDCDLKEWMKQEVENINEHLLSLQEQMRCIFKSTVVALAVTEDQVVWMNVGDSRLYDFQEGKFSSVTRDQSMAYMKYRAGEIAYDEIARDEDQCVLLSALGNARKHKPHIYDRQSNPTKGEAFLLCTDGAWSYLTKEEIQNHLLEAEDAREWGEKLKQEVISRLEENSDNYTIMTVTIE